jgi:asparagine synthase (glutamine-hydrolysing)
LYYARAAGSASGAGAGSQPCGAVAFASELPALRELPWLDKRVYGLGLRCYLEWGMLPMGMTIYWGADKLPPATTTTFSAEGQGEPKRYFDVNAITPQVRDATETRRLVTEAVRRQLVADVPLGCFLSGGIDSSVIAAAMKASVPPDQPVMTFSIGFDDPNYDETAYAQAVAEHLGTVHRQFTVRPDAAEDLPKLAAAFGEPFADSSALPTHYLARETRRHVTVALSGDGGDELFGGYDRYRAMRLGLAGRFAPQLLLSLLARLPGTHPKGKSARLKRFAHSLKLNPADRYASYLRLFSEQQTAALVPASGARVLRAETQDLAAALFEKLSAGRDVVQTALAVDRMLYLPDDPLVKVDRASMLHGLEVRSPMLDPDVIAFAAGLSTAQLMDGGPKRMLREAFGGDLPRWVFSRQKMGFAVPIGDWLRTSLKSMVHDLLLAADAFSSGYFDRRNIETLIHEHETFRADHSQRIYALLMLELWWKSAK